MKHAHSLPAQVPMSAAVLVTLIGWTVVADQLHRDGWADGGTGWLLAFATAATIGATVAIRALATDRHGWAAAGLVATAVSPTVFWYPLNVLVLILALVELQKTFRSSAA